MRLNADKLNDSLLQFIKSSFRGKRIALRIYEDTMDETEYLLSDPVHREKLLATVGEMREQKAYTLDKLKSMFLNKPEA